jgi:hypothetical protein
VRLSLLQVPGGFSDHQDVEIHVVTPPGQAGTEPGNGRTGRSASTATTAEPPTPQVTAEQPSEGPATPPVPAEVETNGSGAVVDEPAAPSAAGSGAVVDGPTPPVAAQADGAETGTVETGAGANASDPAGVSAP